MKTNFIAAASFLGACLIFTSCQKQLQKEDFTPTGFASASTDLNLSDDVVTKGIHLVTWAYWSDFKSDCLPGYWYCWEIDIEPNAKITFTKDYIGINDKRKLIIFGIDNHVNSNYHKNFIEGSNFNFPQDTYIKSSIVKATIGLDKEIYIKKGLYPMKIINGILNITAPFTIID
jgi:hypothetical protein